LLLVSVKITVAGFWHGHCGPSKITVDDSGKNHYCWFLARSLLLVPGKIIVADSWQGHALTRTPFMIPARITVAGSWQDHRCWLLTRSQDQV
jgi:hypothetical protein